jgi:hypothetical protein
LSTGHRRSDKNTVRIAVRIDRDILGPKTDISDRRRRSVLCIEDGVDERIYISAVLQIAAYKPIVNLSIVISGLQSKSVPLVTRVRSLQGTTSRPSLALPMRKR